MAKLSNISRILTLSAAALFALPTATFAADTSGFWLSFPILGKTADTVEINAVFDRYRPYGDYCPDGIVRTTGGLQASSGTRRASSWSSQQRSDCWGPLVNRLHGLHGRR